MPSLTYLSMISHCSWLSQSQKLLSYSSYLRPFVKSPKEYDLKSCTLLRTNVMLNLRVNVKVYSWSKLQIYNDEWNLLLWRDIYCEKEEIIIRLVRLKIGISMVMWSISKPKWPSQFQYLLCFLNIWSDIYLFMLFCVQIHLFLPLQITS